MTMPAPLFQGASPTPPPVSYSIHVVRGKGGIHIPWGAGKSRTTWEARATAHMARLDAMGWTYLTERRACWTVGYGLPRFLGWADGPDAIVRPKRKTSVVRGVALELALGFPSLTAARDWWRSFQPDRSPSLDLDPAPPVPQTEAPAASPSLDNVSIEDLLRAHGTLPTG